MRLPLKTENAAPRSSTAPKAMSNQSVDDEDGSHCGKPDCVLEMIPGSERIDLAVPFHHRTNTFNFFFARRAANHTDTRVLGTLNTHALKTVLAAPDGIHTGMVETFHATCLQPVKNCIAGFIQVSRSSGRIAHLKSCSRNPQLRAALWDRTANAGFRRRKTLAGSPNRSQRPFLAHFWGYYLGKPHKICIFLLVFHSNVS